MATRAEVTSSGDLVPMSEQIRAYRRGHRLPPHEEIATAAFQVWEERDRRVSTPEQQRQDWEQGKVIVAASKMKGPFRPKKKARATVK